MTGGNARTEPGNGLVSGGQSSQIVTGPSFTSATCMWAPKRPVATGTPSAASSAANAATSALAHLGRGGIGEPGPVAAANVGVERELRDDERLTADVHERAVHAPIGVGEDAQPGHLAGQLRGGVRAVSGARRDEHEEAGADRRHPVSVHLHRGFDHPLDQCSHSGREFLIWKGRVLHSKSFPSF